MKSESEFYVYKANRGLYYNVHIVSGYDNAITAARKMNGFIINMLIIAANGAIRDKIYITGYESRATLDNAWKRIMNRFNYTQIGYVVYTYTGGEHNIYNDRCYKALERFNASIFFDAWG